jgi:phage FluMu gp28-like protein
VIDRRITVEEAFPKGWRSHLAGGRIAIGGDIGTTTKAKSNPSCIAVVEQTGMDYWVRALVRFKTTDGDVYEALLREALKLPSGMRARRVCLDATSEKFFAVGQQKRLAGIVPVELVVASEKTTYLGEEMIYKVYLGNLLANTFEENHIAIPNHIWVRNDIRSVKREKGSFEADISEDGGHGDCFDAIKLGLHGLLGKGGPASAKPAQVGSFGIGSLLRRLKNPFAHMFEKRGGTLNA